MCMHGSQYRGFTIPVMNGGSRPDFWYVCLPRVVMGRPLSSCATHFDFLSYLQSYCIPSGGKPCCSFTTSIGKSSDPHGFFRPIFSSCLRTSFYQAYRCKWHFLRCTSVGSSLALSTLSSRWKTYLHLVPLRNVSTEPHHVSRNCHR